MLCQTSISLTALAAAFMLVSCTDSSIQDKKISAQLKRTLNEADISIYQSNAQLMKNLEDQSIDYFTRERAKSWFNIGETVFFYTDRLVKMIDTADPNLPDENFLNAVYKKSMSYRSYILQSDIYLAETFQSQFDLIRPMFSIIEKDSSNKETPGPFITSKEKLRDFLFIYKSKLLILENKILAYCSNRTGTTADWFDVFDPLISQNSQILLPDEILEIRAGIGAYSKKATPEIFINNKSIPLIDSGYAVFKTKAPEKEGDYHFPVVIKYVNYYTGKIETHKKNIFYKVVKPYD
jgi:hypothetical protein